MIDAMKELKWAQKRADELQAQMEDAYRVALAEANAQVEALLGRGIKAANITCEVVVKNGKLVGRAYVKKEAS